MLDADEIPLSILVGSEYNNTPKRNKEVMGRISHPLCFWLPLSMTLITSIPVAVATTIKEHSANCKASGMYAKSNELYKCLGSNGK